ncbi:hypothetical protein ACKVWE_011201 [Pyricularia oryzae]
MEKPVKSDDAGTPAANIKASGEQSGTTDDSKDTENARDNPAPDNNVQNTKNLF